MIYCVCTSSVRNRKYVRVISRSPMRPIRLQIGPFWSLVDRSVHLYFKGHKRPRYQESASLVKHNKAVSALQTGRPQWQNTTFWPYLLLIVWVICQSQVDGHFFPTHCFESPNWQHQSTSLKPRPSISYSAYSPPPPYRGARASHDPHFCTVVKGCSCHLRLSCDLQDTSKLGGHKQQLWLFKCFLQKSEEVKH